MTFDKVLHPNLRLIREYAALLKSNIMDRKLLTELIKWGLELEYHGRPVPLERLLFLRGLVSGEDPLFPCTRAVRTTGMALHNSFLASRLFRKELGAWSLAASTLNFLESQVRIRKPELVLEFGSGISTACLVRYLMELHGCSDRVYVLSIEEDLCFLDSTAKLIEDCNLEKHVRLVHCRLRRQAIEGVETVCYDLFGSSLQTVLKDNRPDFVVIDGPAGEPGAKPSVRFGNLPLARRLLRAGAWFYMDDALRDGELRVAQFLNQLPYVRVDGVYLVGKGLLVGQVGEGINDAFSHRQH